MWIVKGKLKVINNPIYQIKFLQFSHISTALIIKIVFF